MKWVLTILSEMEKWIMNLHNDDYDPLNLKWYKFKSVSRPRLKWCGTLGTLSTWNNTNLKVYRDTNLEVCQDVVLNNMMLCLLKMI